jgi:tetratricopeptide (TPR) repeat protein
MGGHDLLWGWYFTNRAQVRELQGRLGDALEDSRLAVAAKERALGPNTPDLALSVGNLANHLAYGCDFAGAFETNERAVAILTETLGRDHPWTAQTLANRGQFLYRLGRFAHAYESATSSLAVIERETDPQGILVTVPLRTLGLCHLATGRFEDAFNVLARAVSIRDAVEKTPLRLAEVHFPFARALDEAHGDRDHAVALARRARREYEQAAKTPVVARDLLEVEQWLATHAPPMRGRRITGGGTQGGPGARPLRRPRRSRSS